MQAGGGAERGVGSGAWARFEISAHLQALLQVSLLGRGSAISTWAGLIDARFAGPIKIQHRGDLQSTERSFLGSVLGHGARLDGKVLIQPGREIPNGVIVRMRPDEVVSHIPEDLVPGRPYVRDGGTLVPLGSEQRS